MTFVIVYFPRELFIYLVFGPAAAAVLILVQQKQRSKRGVERAERVEAGGKARARKRAKSEERKWALYVCIFPFDSSSFPSFSSSSSVLALLLAVARSLTFAHAERREAKTTNRPASKQEQENSKN